MRLTIESIHLYGIAIAVVNIVIIYIIVITYFFHRRRFRALHGMRDGWLMGMMLVFLAANIASVYTGLRAFFFTPGILITDDIALARFADRMVMLVGYTMLRLACLEVWKHHTEPDFWKKIAK